MYHPPYSILTYIYQILYQCKHGPSRRSACRGKRPHVHTIKLECEAVVRFCIREGFVVLDRFSEYHNHPVSEALYKRDTGKISEEDDELIESLLNANCSPAQIRKCLKEEKNKLVTIRAISYIITKRNSKTKAREEDDLNEFLSCVRKEGGKLNKMENMDGTVRALTITTSVMKSSFQKTRPSVIQVDTTHNIESSGFKLSAIVYYHPVTGKGEVAQLGFIEDESKDVYLFVFHQLKQLLVDDPPIIIIDKDFTEIKSLEAVFPLSVVLLCLFHVLKYWKGMITTAPVEQNVKNDILELMRSMLYASSRDQYLELYNKFNIDVKGVVIRVKRCSDMVYEDLTSVFSQNWNSCVDMWGMYARKMLPGIGDENTNNRIESNFKRMKEHLKLYSRSLSSIQDAVIRLTRWAEDKITTGTTEAKRHRLRIYDPDPARVHIYDDASFHLNDSGVLLLKAALESLKIRRPALKLESDGVLEMFRNSKKDQKIYHTDMKSCNCSFALRYCAPCRHVLFFRENSSVPVFDTELFNVKYRRDLSDSMCGPARDLNVADILPRLDIEDSDDDDYGLSNAEIPLSNEDKYITYSPILHRISDLLQRFGTEQMKEYVQELLQVEERIRFGRPIFQMKEDVPCDNLIDKYQSSNANLNLIEKSEKGEFHMKFKSKVKSRGRPKGKSKVRYYGYKEKRVIKETSKNFKPIKSVNNNDLSNCDNNCQALEVDTRITDEDVSNFKEAESDNNRRDELICFSSRHLGSRTGINIQDYLTLQTGVCLTSLIVNFALKEEATKTKSPLLIFDCDVAQIVASQTWFLDKRLAPYLDKAWRDPECELVLLPCCHDIHYYILAAVLNEKDPVVMVLESIGGSYAVAPPVTEQFKSMLEETKQLMDGTNLKFRYCMQTRWQFLIIYYF